MIVLKRIAFLRPLLLHANMLMRFSEEAKREQLSVSAQKAVWATSIIQTISKASLPKTIRDPTLRDVILNLPDPSKEFHFDKAEKNEVMKLFTEGILLASPFLAQPRLQSALQKGVSHKPSDKATKQFIFYPNRSVTTPMFKQLMRASAEHQTNFLLTGGYGISKTVSIILFIHLTYHQTRFIYEASKDEKKQEEYDKLVKLKLVPGQVVKYWYWSVYKNTDKQIKKLILEQAVELQPAARAELMQQPQLRDFINKLRSYYNIPCLLQRPIVDQVNTIASLMRRANQNIQQIKFFNPDPKYQALSLCQSLKIFLLLGSYYTLNSSAAIEKKLLRRGYKEFLGMDLVDSQRGLSTVRISYEETVSTKAGQLDFWQTFWFEIERRANLEPAQLQSAKQTFFQSIQSRKLSNLQTLKKSTLSAYFCFAYIREFVQKNIQKLMESLKSKDFEKVQEIIKDFYSFSLQESKQIIINFLEKGDQKYKKQVLLKLYLKANWLKQNDNYRYRGLLLPVSSVDQILSEETFSQKRQSTIRTQKEEARNDIKTLQVFQTEHAIKFIFTIQEFTLLAEQIIRKGKFTYLDLLKSLREPSLEFGTPAIDRKLTPESYLINCLAQQSGLSFNAVQKPSFIQTGKHFQIYQVVPFDKLRKIKKALKDQQDQQDSYEQQNQQDQQGQYDPQDPSDKYKSFEQHFRSAIEIALQNPREDILALPYKMKDGLRIGYASSNPTVYFAILRYNKQLNRFQIESFDVTIQRDLTQKMLEARTLFTKLFEGVKSIKGIPFSLSHTYLSPKDATYQQQEINNAPPLAIPLTISFADISKLTITTESFWNLHMFKHVIDITKREEDMQYKDLFLKYDC